MALKATQNGPSDDLTGYTPVAQLRSSGYKTGDANLNITAVLVPDPDTEDPNREIKLEIFASESRALAPGTYQFGLELIPPEGAEYAVALLSGTFRILPEIVT